MTQTMPDVAADTDDVADAVRAYRAAERALAQVIRTMADDGKCVAEMIGPLGMEPADISRLLREHADEHTREIAFAFAFNLLVVSTGEDQWNNSDFDPCEWWRADLVKVTRHLCSLAGGLVPLSPRWTQGAVQSIRLPEWFLYDFERTLESSAQAETLILRRTTPPIPFVPATADAQMADREQRLLSALGLWTDDQAASATEKVRQAHDDLGLTLLPPLRR